MKKALVLTMTLALVLSMLCGCGSILGSAASSSSSGDNGNRSDAESAVREFLNITDPYEELRGTWTSIVPDTVDEARSLLESIDAYEPELAIADLYCLEYAKTVTFTEDKTYFFGYDIEGTKACVRRFLDTYFNDLYDGRTTLNEPYGMTFDDMSRDEFLTFYAELYSYTNYEEMLDGLTANAYRYDELAVEGIENGTYTIDDDYIMCTITGESVAEGMKYSIDGDQLTLVYTNATEVYTKVG